jgi:hypothetical protein
MPLRRIRNTRSFEKCRTCGHFYLSHTDVEHDPSRCQNLVNGNCRCVEFLPQDNLEFLEYKYGRDQLAVKTGDKGNEGLQAEQGSRG